MQWLYITRGGQWCSITPIYNVKHLWRVNWLMAFQQDLATPQITYRQHPTISLIVRVSPSLAFIRQQELTIETCPITIFNPGLIWSFNYFSTPFSKQNQTKSNQVQFFFFVETFLEFSSPFCKARNIGFAADHGTAAAARVPATFGGHGAAATAKRFQRRLIKTW